MGRTGTHTAVAKGKRVRVAMKNGTVFVDKFLDRKSRHVVFENHKVTKGDIDSMTIYRHQNRT